MVRSETIEKVKEENKKRHDKSNIGQIEKLLVKCNSNELLRIMKDIKHKYLKNAINRVKGGNKKWQQ